MTGNRRIIHLEIYYLYNIKIDGHRNVNLAASSRKTLSEIKKQKSIIIPHALRVSPVLLVEYVMAKVVANRY